MTEWQPIETVPNDIKKGGRFINAGRDHPRYGFSALHDKVRWSNDISAWCFESGEPCFPQPTHWLAPDTLLTPGESND